MGLGCGTPTSFMPAATWTAQVTTIMQSLWAGVKKKLKNQKNKLEIGRPVACSCDI